MMINDDDLNFFDSEDADDDYDRFAIWGIES